MTTYYPYSLYLTPFESRAVYTRNGGLHIWDPEYAFWKRILTNPMLKEEFMKRVISSNGYIEWDFLSAGISGFPPGQQYRMALHYIITKLNMLRPPSNSGRRDFLLPPPAGVLNSNFKLVFDNPVNDLEFLRRRSKQVIDWRKHYWERYDTWSIWFRELYKKPTPTKNHKQVYWLWVKIHKLVERKLEAFVAAENGVRPRCYGVCDGWNLFILIVIFLGIVGLILWLTGETKNFMSYLQPISVAFKKMMVNDQ